MAIRRRQQEDGLVDAALTPERQEEPPSATDAVGRLIDAAERLVIERIELAALDVQEVVATALWRMFSLGFILLFALSGWWSMMAALVLLLHDRFSFPLSLAVVGLCHAVAGAVILFAIRPTSSTLRAS
jgi:uncharacterized membrane protein YqjE